MVKRSSRAIVRKTTVGGCASDRPSRHIIQPRRPAFHMNLKKAVEPQRHQDAERRSGETSAKNGFIRQGSFPTRSVFSETVFSVLSGSLRLCGSTPPPRLLFQPAFKLRPSLRSRAGYIPVSPAAGAAGRIWPHLESSDADGRAASLFAAALTRDRCGAERSPRPTEIASLLRAMFIPTRLQVETNPCAPAQGYNRT